MVAIRAAVMALPAARIALDGEAVALPDFHALLRRSGAATACLYAFDLLHLGDDDLRGLALATACSSLLQFRHLARPASEASRFDRFGVATSSCKNPDSMSRHSSLQL